MIALTPPVFNFVCLAFICVGAVICAALKHVRLIPNNLVTSLHGAAAQLIRLGASSKCDVERGGCCGRLNNLKSHLLEWLNNVDRDATDFKYVLVAINGSHMFSDQRVSTYPTQLQRVHLAPSGKMGKS